MKIFFLFLEFWSVWIWLPLGIIMVIAIFGNYGFCLIGILCAIPQKFESPLRCVSTAQPGNRYYFIQKIIIY